MLPQHQKIKEACLKNLREAGLSEEIETVLPHFSYDGSTAIFIFWADGGGILLIEGPEDRLPAIVLERVRKETWLKGVA